MTKKFIVTMSALALVGGALALSKPALADNETATRPGFWQMIESKAEILGLSGDDLISRFKEGKNFVEIAEEQGISQEDFRTQIQTQHEERLAQMVADGVITQEQADDRKAFTEERREDCDQDHEGMGGHFMGMGGKGLGKGLGFWADQD